MHEDHGPAGDWNALGDQVGIDTPALEGIGCGHRIPNRIVWTEGALP